jgi:hypothetical protein
MFSPVPGMGKVGEHTTAISHGVEVDPRQLPEGLQDKLSSGILGNVKDKFAKLLESNGT